MTSFCPAPNEGIRLAWHKCNQVQNWAAFPLGQRRATSHFSTRRNNFPYISKKNLFFLTTSLLLLRKKQQFSTFTFFFLWEWASWCHWIKFNVLRVCVTELFTVPIIIIFTSIAHWIKNPLWSTREYNHE